MTPTWLIALALVSPALAFVSAGFILVDELSGSCPLMPVMKLVWPITALYMGQVAIWAQMKIAMVVGFATAYTMNWRLIKEAI